MENLFLITRLCELLNTRGFCVFATHAQLFTDAPQAVTIKKLLKLLCKTWLVVMRSFENVPLDVRWAPTPQGPEDPGTSAIQMPARTT